MKLKTVGVANEISFSQVPSLLRNSFKPVTGPGVATIIGTLVNSDAKHDFVRAGVGEADGVAAWIALRCAIGIDHANNLMDRSCRPGRTRCSLRTGRTDRSGVTL